MLKGRVLATILFLSLCLMPIAATAADDLKVGGALTGKFWSSYLGQSGQMICDKPVLWSDLYLTLKPTGFFFDVWNSTGFEGAERETRGCYEIDYTLGWSSTMGLTVGVSYFDLYTLFGPTKGDVIMPFVEVERPIAGDVSVSMRLEYYFPAAPGYFPSGGLRVLLGAEHLWQFSNPVALRHKLWAIYDEGTLGLREAGIFQYEAALRWREVVPRSIAIEVPKVKLSAPITNAGDPRKFEAIFGASISFQF